MIDSSDFYIGDVSFYSDDRNIILKGDTGIVHNLNSITIKNNESNIKITCNHVIL